MKFITNFKSKSLPILLIATIFLQMLMPVIVVSAQEIEEAIDNENNIVVDVTPTIIPTVVQPTSTIIPTLTPTVDTIPEEVVESTPTVSVTATPTTIASDIETNLELTITPTPTSNPTKPTQTVTNEEEENTLEEQKPMWAKESNVWQTNYDLEIGEEYIISELNNLKVIFTELPVDTINTLYISEVTSILDGKEIKGYEITSNMENGTFEYDLYMPIPQELQNQKDLQVKYTENGSKFLDIVNENLIDGYLLVKSLNHFTVFVIVTPDPVNVDCSNASVTTVVGDTCYNSLQDAIDNAVSGDTIELTDNSSLSERVEFNTGVNNITLEGNGHTIMPTWDNTANYIAHNYSNNASLGIFADNITIQNLIIDGVGGIDLHGINIYQVNGTYLNNVTLSNNDFSGLVVNSSNVTVHNITTDNNGWYGINVDDAGGLPASLLINGTNSHTDIPIYVDDRNDIDNGNVVIDANQYTRNNGAPFSGDYYTLSCATTTVHNINTSEDFCTIQDAIDDTDTVDGNTIIVDDGTFVESIVVDKALTLSASTNTILDGSTLSNRDVASITIASNDVTINGFHITGYQKGVISEDPLLNGGQAFNNIHIQNNIIYNLYGRNLSSTCGGIRRANGVQIGADSENFLPFYTSVGCHWTGHAIVTQYNYSGLLIENNEIYDTYAGIVLGGTFGNQNIQDNSITTSIATGITLNTSQDINISTNIINNNHGAGIYLCSSKNATWNSAYEILTNDALSPRNINITDNTINNNAKTNWGGGGSSTYEQKLNNGISILSAWPSTVEIHDNEINNNDTMADGINNIRGGNGIGNFTDGQVNALDNDWDTAAGDNLPRDPWSGDGSHYDVSPMTTAGDYAYGNILYALCSKTVLNTNDTGIGSLREAITCVNTYCAVGTGHDIPDNLIDFNIPNSGVSAEQIIPTTELPALTCNGTTIDGSTQNSNQDNNVEIFADPHNTLSAGWEYARATTPKEYGLSIQADNVRLNYLSIYGFGEATGQFNGTTKGSWYGNSADIVAGTFTNNASSTIPANGLIIENSFIGSSYSMDDPEIANRSTGVGIKLYGGNNHIIRNNFIGNSEGRGITSSGTNNLQIVDNLLYNINNLGISLGATRWGNNFIGVSTNYTITENIIYQVGQMADYSNKNGMFGISLSCGGGTFSGNIVAGGGGMGVETYGKWRNYRGTPINFCTGNPTYIINNTIAGNRYNGILGGKDYTSVNPGGNSLQDYRIGALYISQNSIYGNGGLGIDLDGYSDTSGGLSKDQAWSQLHTTLNANPKTRTITGDTNSSNSGINYSVITRAEIVGGNLEIEGFAPAGSSIEFFLSDGTMSPTGPNHGFGEGEYYLITLVEGSSDDTNAGSTAHPTNVNGVTVATSGYIENQFTFVIPVFDRIVDGAVLTSTATVSRETSEFGNNFEITQDLFPTVVIVANPGTTVVEGTTVTLTADADGGDPTLSYLWSGDCSGTNITTTVPNTVGTYNCTVTVTDIDGDSATDSITITVTPIPATPTPTPTSTVINEQSEEIPEVETYDEVQDEIQNEDKDILGVNTCKESWDISGYVFIDKNDNDTREDNENDGIKDIEVTVYYFDHDNERVDVATVTTDKHGLWEATLCPGTYYAEIDTNDLPRRTTVQEDTITIKVVIDEILDDANFIVNKQAFNWWLCLIPIILILIALFLLWLKERQQEEERNK